MMELRFELLIGRRVMDASGARAIGRIEEAIVEARDGEFVVTEFRVGAEALVDRLGLRPFTVHLPGRAHAYRVRWDQLDLSDPQHPRLTVAPDQLQKWRNGV